MRALAVVALLAAGCGDDGAPDDFAVPADLSASTHPVQLTVGDRTTPMAAWYSLFIEPLEATTPGQADLVVTFIDPAFACSSQVATGLNAISFQFLARVAGVTSNFVLGRAGPDLGPLMGGGTGEAQLTAVDDRFVSFNVDGGMFNIDPGGMVSGFVHWSNANVVVDGTFTAPHCANLDFAAAP